MSRKTSFFYFHYFSISVPLHSTKKDFFFFIIYYEILFVTFYLKNLNSI